MTRLVTFIALPYMLAAAPATKPTFHQDVLPILQRNCQGCHRPGEAAPMSLLTYKDARPFAAAIKASVSQRRMPPWHADPQVNHFSNDRTMPQAEIDTLVAWANTGASEGDPKRAPKALSFADGWSIGKPDFVVEMPQTFQVPASGTIEYHYVILPLNLKEDVWVSAAEARPENRAVNHHIIAFVREPGSKWMRDQAPGVPFIPKTEDGGVLSNFLTGYAPGTVPERYRPGQAKLIKAGSDVVLQLHWTANGKAAADRAKVGFVLAKEAPTERIYTLAASTTKFEIPAGADNHRVDAKMKLYEDTVLESLVPHMHVRGKSFSMQAELPSGEKVDLLRVPRYDFNWQLTYSLAKPMKLPKGTVIHASGWFDNSPNNKNNPDPTKPVHWGEQSWEEMMMGFFNIAVPREVSFNDIVRPKKKPATSASSAGGQD
jgi:hypothetical protein